MIVFWSIGSSHSDKEVDTPEKLPKVPASERKRKRKADDGGMVGKGGDSSGGTPTSSSKSSKKINDYFASKAPGGSPIRNAQGAKSPSPHQTIKSNVCKLIHQKKYNNNT